MKQDNKIQVNDILT